MNEFFNAMIAQIFERFRTKNPMAAAAIILIALTTSYFADQGELLGVFTLPIWLAPILKWVGLFAAALVSPRVTAYLPDTLREKRELDYLATLSRYGLTPKVPLQEEQAEDLEKARSDIRRRSHGGTGLI